MVLFFIAGAFRRRACGSAPEPRVGNNRLVHSSRADRRLVEVQRLSPFVSFVR
jgi:hypothetical protein